ncbi:hypothetical protein E4U14_002163 [Claviceps sp. LM454 group G7]|nr:hypothetical protein E4U14_002163 [Claviceps sp. LM454 group G7]
MVLLKAQGLWSRRNSPQQKPWQQRACQFTAESPIHFVSGKSICMQAPGKPKPSNHMDFRRLMSVSCTEISSPSIFED